MDTINNQDGCFYRALDDEPVFVLLARDPSAAEAVRWWVTLRQALIGSGEKPLEDHDTLSEALKTAAAMTAWRYDATDPAKWGPGSTRWHQQIAPKRELVEAGLLGKLESRLLTNANQFLMYAQNHFDKGTRESDEKGEVNWQHYLDICADLGLQPCAKPVGKRKDEPFGGLPYSHDELRSRGVFIWQIGNRFLMWGDDNGQANGQPEWFLSEFMERDNNWSGAYPIQPCLQRDMLIAAYREVRSMAHHKTDLIKSLVPDHRGLIEKIAVGLRQLTDDISAFIGDKEDTQRVRDLWSFADRINGYAAELEAADGIQTYRDTVAEIRRHISSDKVRIVAKHPALGMPYGTPPVVPADIPSPTEIIEQIGEATGTSFDALTGTMRKAESDTLDVTATPDMPPHRFTMFTKAKGWAYGRGLEINPAHIPDMLDRMDKDGWHLQCVFGGVEPAKVGMLFRRMDTILASAETPPLTPANREMLAAPTEGIDDIDLGRQQQP